MTYTELKVALYKELTEKYSLPAFDISKAEDRFYHIPKTDCGLAFALCKGDDGSLFLSVNFINHKSNEKIHLNFSDRKNKISYSKEDFDRMEEERRQKTEEIRQKKEEYNRLVFERAKTKSSFCPSDNEYIRNHNIQNFLIKNSQNCRFSKYEIYVPLYDISDIIANEKIDFEAPCSYQVIKFDNNENKWVKRFSSDSKGRIAIIASKNTSLENIYVAEGFATGCKVAENIENGIVIVSNGSGNLDRTTEFVKWLKLRNSSKLHLCMDNDRKNDYERSRVEIEVYDKIKDDYDFLHFPPKNRTDFCDYTNEEIKTILNSETYEKT